MPKNREKFIELAEKRVTKAIKNLRLIGNLSNKSNYSYTEEDVKKIVGVLDLELKNIRRRFESKGVEEKITFKL